VCKQKINKRIGAHALEKKEIIKGESEKVTMNEKKVKTKRNKPKTSLQRGIQAIMELEIDRTQWKEVGCALLKENVETGRTW
jgi:fatty acid/phospholipid biosynthesis enzyme